MFRKNRIVFVLLATMCVLSASKVFARGGLLAGEKNIRYVQTKYFDIIYPESSEASAAHLALHADDIYDEICEAYGVNFRRRMPVTISPSSDYFNAYFTISPFNHIVLLDALPTEDMLVENDNILNTFRHELTHGVTMTYNTEGLRKLQQIFGDLYNTELWGVTSFLAESATVSFESQNGEGRLYDGYYLHHARQCKLQNTFPSFRDVTGARDIYPTGSFYSFGGVFAGWLQKKYGMQKYSEWWFECVNVGIKKSEEKSKSSSISIHTYEGYFLDVYGLTMEKAWEDFKNELYVPGIASDPLTEKGVCDFFSALGGEKVSARSLKNSMSSRFEGLSAAVTSGGKKMFVYIDSASSCVYLVRENEDGTIGNPKKLFAKSMLQGVNLSSDGRFMAVATLSRNSANYKNKTLVYDVEKKSFAGGISLPLRDSTVICADGKYYLCGIYALGQKETLEVYRLNVENGSVQNAVKVSETALPVGDMFFSLCDASAFSENGEALVAGIYKCGLKWTVRTVSVSETDGVAGSDGAGCAKLLWKEAVVPVEGARLRALRCGTDSDGKPVLTFTWITQNIFPRLGELRLYKNFAEFSMMNTDISGGVNAPVLLGNNVYYSGDFIFDSRLFVRSEDCFEFKKHSAELNEISDGTLAFVVAGTESKISSEKEALSKSLPYNKLYNSHGVWLPVGTITLVDNKFNQNMATSVGVTWLSGNPWDSDTIQLSAGFDPYSMTGGVGAAFSGGSGNGMGTPLYEYSAVQTALFDSDGFLQAQNQIAFAQNLEVGLHSSISFTEQNSVFAGRQYTEDDTQQVTDYLEALSESSSVTGEDYLKIFGMNKASDPVYYFSDLWAFTPAFSNVHYTGPGYYEKFGVKVGLEYYGYYMTDFSNFTGGTFMHNLSPSVSVHIPCLLPFSCEQGKTYNLPLVVEAAYTPSVTELFNFGAETVLYATEIQKACKWFIYFNRFEVTAEYSGSMVNPDNNASFEIFRVAQDISKMNVANLSDMVSLKFMLTAGPNFGTFTRAHLSLGAQVYYKWHRTADDQSWPFGITLATSTRF